ncbi:MAG: hypothetical protein ACKOQ4_13655, partial [Mycobacterium sp.]
MPLPNNLVAVNRPVAEAFGGVKPPGPDVVVDDAGVPAADRPPNSRRVNASAVHINGAAAGASPVAPVCSHPSSPLPNPDTAPPAATAAPEAAAAGAAFIDGAAPAGAVAAITGGNNGTGAGGAGGNGGAGGLG